MNVQAKSITDNGRGSQRRKTRRTHRYEVTNYMEYCDVYTLDRKRTGKTKERKNWVLEPDEYFLFVLAVVKRPDGRFLITRRSMDKAWAAGWWEIPGGAVHAGEDSREAALRELLEETGIDASGCEDGYVFSYHRDNPESGNNYITDIYCFEMDFSDEQICIEEEETLEYRIATAEEIRAWGEQGIFLHYDSIRRVFS